MTVDHLFSAFPRVVIVSAVDIHSFDMMAVAVNKICSIGRHDRYFLVRREYAALPVTDNYRRDGAMMETVCLIFMFRTRPDTPTVDGMIISA